jgi:hypothetical protein
MAQRIATVLLWLFVINLGIAFGAGMYESRVMFPQWLSGSPESGYHWNAQAVREANTGVRFWLYVTTVPLTLITLANLVVAWRAQGAVRSWWLGAAGVALAERIFTFAYFIPTLLTLQSAVSLPESQAVAMASQWGRLDYVRHAMSLTAWLAALRAFSLFESKHGG